ncbi:hypothetical protein POM88_002043 [Heracleum sosnowskyi]|uniref:Uncharacterized protein n=1 Tax=Heracleum sosnowskyi TaxID=360622 RepID=A0AAD8NC87_9APIA|nr:hypothetical protein POM88_002043 [Heracleum sosnowskyi]
MDNLDRYAEVMHHPFDEDSYTDKFINLIFHGNYNGLLAFDRDGSVMRRTSSPELGDNMVFPFFHDGDLKNELFDNMLLVPRRPSQNSSFHHATYKLIMVIVKSYSGEVGTWQLVQKHFRFSSRLSDNCGRHILWARKHVDISIWF